MHTQEGTPNFMTENLSTGVLDEAGAQQDTGADPPAAEAAKAISAIVTEAATSVTSISNPRLEWHRHLPRSFQGAPKCLPLQLLPSPASRSNSSSSGPHLGQVKIRSLILDSDIWVPAAGTEAQGTDSEHH